MDALKASMERQVGQTGSKTGPGKTLEMPSKKSPSRKAETKRRRHAS
jgi:hypothetical protein